MYEAMTMLWLSLVSANEFLMYRSSRQLRRRVASFQALGTRWARDVQAEAEDVGNASKDGDGRNDQVDNAAARQS